MKTETVETDVLCIGGGIAGLMAAIRARELGAKVVVAEKGATKYSGAGRIGNDHFWCYIPEYHGPDLDAFIKECMLTQLGNMTSNLGPRVVRTWLEYSYDMVKLWDSWGIQMKHDGEWHFSGHSFPDRVMTHLKYKGANQKPVLTEQALKRGATIMDRVMIFELLGGPQGCTGAIGIDTRQDRLIEFRAKSVVVGTGAVVRLYPGVTPAVMGNNQTAILGHGRWTGHGLQGRRRTRQRGTLRPPRRCQELLSGGPGNVGGCLSGPGRKADRQVHPRAEHEVR